MVADFQVKTLSLHHSYGSEKAECERKGGSFESWRLWGKERGYNLGINGGEVKGEISSDDRLSLFFVEPPQMGCSAG